MAREFELFVKFMREHPNVWSKVSCPERLSHCRPQSLNGEQNAYTDVIPFARRIVETFPDRVLWGTDWPHPNLKDHMPDDGLLVTSSPTLPSRPSCSASCWWTTPCACTGLRRNDDVPRQTLPRRARHHDF
jgi:predicted TIM-barrel fold metal-dependent hydrolase